MSEKEKKSNNFEFNKSKKKHNFYRYIKYLPVDEYIIRPIASLIVRAVYKTSITPNQLTFINFFFGILSGIAYCFGKPIYFIIGAILIQISLVFDCADGMLARAKDMCSHYGAYLDLLLDRIVDFFLFGGIVIGQYVYSGNLKLFIAGIFTVALLFLEISIFYVIQNYKKRETTGETGPAKSMVIFIIFIFSLINRLDIFMVALMIGICFNIIFKVIVFLASKPKK